MSGTFVCWACKNKYASIFKEEHHAIPQAAGGTQKDIVSLCSKCHRGLHSVASAMASKSKRRTLDLAVNSFGEDEDTRKRIKELAALVVKHMQKLKEGSQGKTTRPVTVEIPISIHKGLTFLAKDSGLSIKDFVIQIVFDKVLGKFPSLKEGEILRYKNDKSRKNKT